MKYLVDTNILSETTKSEPNPAVIDWLRLHEQELAIDAVVLGEIRLGILLLPSGSRRSKLDDWFASVISRTRCLEWDGGCAMAWAALLAKLRRKGATMPLKDSMIAASALSRSLTVVTRNVADFRTAGVPLFNPFSGR